MAKPASDAPAIQVESGDGWSAATAQGLGRKRNSDAFAVSTRGPVRAFAVADGVGSLEASPDAARAAVDAVVDWAEAQQGLGPDSPTALAAAVNRAVARAFEARATTEGATTLACVLMTDSGGFALTVGDSELLLIPEDGPAERVNVLDHIPSRPNVLLAWLDGRTPFEPHVYALDATEGLLCLVTDGVTKVVDYARIAGIVRENPLSGGMGGLLTASREAGATDDLTAVAVGLG